MTKDVLLVRAGIYHLALPAERLLEIIDLKTYHKQQIDNLHNATLKTEIQTDRVLEGRKMPSSSVSIESLPQSKCVNHHPHSKTLAIEEPHLHDQYRMWRNQILPVMNLGHFLDPSLAIMRCRFSLVYQANTLKPQEILFLDVSHIFRIIHMDMSDAKPIYYPYQELAKFSKTIYPLQQEGPFAFILEESLDLMEAQKQLNAKEKVQIDPIELSAYLHAIEENTHHPAIPKTSLLPESAQSFSASQQKCKLKASKGRKKKKES